MKLVLRILVYLVLLAGATHFSRHFFASYSQRMERAAKRYEGLDAPVAPAGEVTNAPAKPATNEATVLLTNRVAASSNHVAASGTNAAATTPTPAPSTNPPPAPTGATSGSSPTVSGGSIGVQAAAALGCVVLLALLIGHDVANYVAQRVHRELYNDQGEGASDPEYEQAEQVWANGDHLEAIRLMRDYYKRNPRLVHVVLRIAEIYEKDLANHLAAALEYEEILKLRLDPERWGWAAIHLCNLYYHIGQQAKADFLLRRIVKEYGQTAAARKARERLGLAEGDELTEEGVTGDLGDTGGRKLPPGFRPKKR